MKVIFVLAAVIVAGKFNRACILIIIFSDSENMIKVEIDGNWCLLTILEINICLMDSHINQKQKFSNSFFEVTGWEVVEINTFDV